MNRTKTIKIRLTDSEYSQLKTRAGGRGISALLRNRALGNDRQQDRIEKLAVVTELARARNALNQISLNCKGRPLPEQVQIVEQLIAVERELSQFRKP